MWQPPLDGATSCHHGLADHLAAEHTRPARRRAHPAEQVDLDDFEVRDSRILTPGTGVTVGPGLYFPGQFGVRTEISVYLSPGGPEITTPAQEEVEARA